MDTVLDGSAGLHRGRVRDAEGVLLLGLLAARFRFEPVPGRTPEPTAHLTVRSRNGVWLSVRRR